MRRAARIDSNQPAIVAALRGIGASVESLARVGSGVPDLLVGFRGQNWLLEVKTDAGTLTPDQVAWHRAWDGQAVTVRSVDDALSAVGALVGAKRVAK